MGEICWSCKHWVLEGSYCHAGYHSGNMSRPGKYNQCGHFKLRPEADRDG